MRALKSAAFAAVSTLALTLALGGAAFAADANDANANGGTLVSGNNDGWYVSGSTGFSLMENARNHNGSAVHYDTDADNPGFDVNGAIGRDFGNGFRAEGELGYRQIGIDHVTAYGTGFPSGDANGDANALSLMANGYYDFKNSTPFTPYIGAGVGVAHVGLNNLQVGGRPLVDDHDLDFAYQAMAGVSYQLAQNGTLFTEYRYFAVNDPTFDTVGGGQVHSELATNNIEVGYRIAF